MFVSDSCGGAWGEMRVRSAGKWVREREEENPQLQLPHRRAHTQVLGYLAEAVYTGASASAP